MIKVKESRIHKKKKEFIIKFNNFDSIMVYIQRERLRERERETMETLSCYVVEFLIGMKITKD